MKGYRKLQQIQTQYHFIKLTRFIYFGVSIGLILQIMNLIPSVVLQRMIDDYIPMRQLNAIYSGIAILIIIPLISTTFILFQKVWINSKAKSMGHQLSLTLFNKLMNQSLDFYQRNNSNELLSYCNKNFYSYLLFWMSEFPSVVVNGVISMIYFIWLTSIHWWYALILIIYIPLLKIPGDFMSAKVGVYFKDIITHNARSSEIIGEVFKGIRTVKLNHLQPIWIKELKGTYQRVETFWNKVVLYDNMSGIWMNQFVAMLFKSLCLALGFFLILQDKMSIGQLMLIFTMSGSYFSLVHQIIYSKFSLSKHEAEHEQLFTYLDLEESSSIDPEGSELSSIQTIEFKNVSFAYQDTSILSRLNLKVKQGEWIGIIGESGIGKSTLLDILVGLYQVKEGCILINEKRLSCYNEEQLANQIVYLSQTNYVFSGSIKSNLYLVKPDASDKEMRAVLEQVGLLDVIAKLPDGIETKMGEDGAVFSQGEKQRFIIAQGLLKGASLYLLDEMTAHLDVDTEMKIRILFKSLQREKGVTIISVSHHHNFLVQADEVYELKKGQGLCHFELKKT